MKKALVLRLRTFVEHERRREHLVPYERKKERKEEREREIVLYTFTL